MAVQNADVAEQPESIHTSSVSLPRFVSAGRPTASAHQASSLFEPEIGALLSTMSATLPMMSVRMMISPLAS
jgi:hypothetical protein